jgi:restriction system protein
MPIPDFQSVFLPLLEQVSDGKEYKLRDIMDSLADRFQLTEDEKNKLLPSGSQRIFDNRVAWAKSYLKKAGLLDSPKRAVIVITPKGLSLLAENPAVLNVRSLYKYSEFVEFHTAKHEDTGNNVEGVGNDITAETPEETLDKAYLSIRKALAEDLIGRVLNLSPAFFERLVVELLVKMGYGGSIADAGKAVGKSGDEGIDGTIKEDKLGLDIIYIQAKRWQPGNVVGRPEIHKFVGALAGQGAKKGIFITTSSFTKDAIEYVPRNETKIVLIDGVQLAQLMIDYNLGVSLQQSYEIKRLDNDYFEDEG